MTDRMEVIEIAINKIRPAAYQPRQHFEKETIEALGASIKANGLIQPITVRKDKKGENYEIIAGERRWRAATLIGRKTIPAIINNVDDFTAKEISIIENYQRVDLSDTEREKYIHDLYEDGKKNGCYKSIADMSRKTGIGNETIGTLVNAYKDRNILKKLNLPMSKVATDDFTVTRILDQTSPQARNELLAIRADDRAGEIMPQREMRKVVQNIKQVTPDNQASVAKLIREEKVEPKDLETVVSVIKDISSEKQGEIIKLLSDKQLEPKNVERFVKVLTEAAPDIQRKMLRSEITAEEAEKVKIFKTPQQRAQVIEERKIIAQGYKEDDERHVSVRKKMADDVEAGIKPTTASVRFDMRGRDDNVVAERTLERYKGIHIEVLSFRADHILSIKNIEMQNQIIDVVRHTAAHCNQVLQKVNDLSPLLVKKGVKKLEA